MVSRKTHVKMIDNLIFFTKFFLLRDNLNLEINHLFYRKNRDDLVLSLNSNLREIFFVMDIITELFLYMNTFANFTALWFYYQIFPISSYNRRILYGKYAHHYQFQINKKKKLFTLRYEYKNSVTADSN